MIPFPFDLPVPLDEIHAWAERVKEIPAPFFFMRGAGGWAAQSHDGTVDAGFWVETDFKLDSIIDRGFSIKRVNLLGYRHDLDQIMQTPAMFGGAQTLIARLSLIYPCRMQLRMVHPGGCTSKMIETDVAAGRHSATIVIPLSGECRVEHAGGPLTLDRPVMLDTSLRHRFVNQGQSRSFFVTIKTYDLTGLTPLPCAEERWLRELRLRDLYNFRRAQK